MEAIPKALCPNMVELHKNSHPQAIQDDQTTSLFNQIKAIPGQIEAQLLQVISVNQS